MATIRFDIAVRCSVCGADLIAQGVNENDVEVEPCVTCGAAAQERIRELERHLGERIEIEEVSCKCSQVEGPCIHKRKEGKN